MATSAKKNGLPVSQRSVLVRLQTGFPAAAVDEGARGAVEVPNSDVEARRRPNDHLNDGVMARNILQFTR